jgi:hypothetical protein
VADDRMSSRPGQRPINVAHPGDAAMLAWKKALRLALAEHDLEDLDIAAVCLVDASMVSRWKSRACRDVLGVAHLAMLAPAYPALVVRLLEHIGEQTGTTIAPRRAEAIDARSAMDLLGAIHRESSELITTLIAASTRQAGDDRDITDAELDALERELRDVQRLVDEGARLVKNERTARARGTTARRLHRAGVADAAEE